MATIPLRLASSVLDEATGEITLCFLDEPGEDHEDLADFRATRHVSVVIQSRQVISTDLDPETGEVLEDSQTTRNTGNPQSGGKK